MTLHEEGLIFLNHNFLRPMGKNEVIFELAENLTSVVLTKLDTELGLTQPQLVCPFFRGANIWLFAPLKEYLLLGPNHTY